MRDPLTVSDFDGTIFHQDTGHVLFDRYGCGAKRREELDSSIGKTRSFREASEEMWGSLNVTLEDGLKALKESLVLDQDFKPFLEYCEAHNIPFSVISAGLKPLLRGALDAFLGPERSSTINIVSNDADIQGTKWKPVWRHESELGHDKARSIREFKESAAGENDPLIVFIGDGVSDLAAASQADILFARRGLKLEEYCIEHQIPYIPYDSFKDVQVDVKSLVRGNRFHDPDYESNASSTASSEMNSPIVYGPATPAVELPKNPMSGRPVNMRTISERSVGERPGNVDLHVA